MSIFEKPGVIVLENQPIDPTGKYEYKAILEKSTFRGSEHKWVLKIVGLYPNGISLTPGQWYLDTLLGFDDFSHGPINDIIYIDYGQKWYVKGMVPVLKEAEEIIYGSEKNQIDEEFVDKYAHIPMRMRNWYQKPENQPGYEEPKKIKIPRKKKPSEKILRKIEDLEGEIQDLKYNLKSLRDDNTNRNNESEQYSSDIIERYGWDFLDMLNSGLSREEKLKAIEEWNMRQDEKHRDIKNPESILREHDYYYGEDSEKEEEDLEKQIEEKETELVQLSEIYELY